MEDGAKMRRVGGRVGGGRSSGLVGAARPGPAPRWQLAFPADAPLLASNVSSLKCWVKNSSTKRLRSLEVTALSEGRGRMTAAAGLGRAAARRGAPAQSKNSWIPLTQKPQLHFLVRQAEF